MTERKSPKWAWLEHEPARLPPHLTAYAGTGLWDERTIAEQATALAEAAPGFVVLIEGETEVTRGEVVADAEALSAALHARGLRPGDVIAFQVPNWREAMVINLAAAMSGFVVNPIVPIYRDHEVSLMLADCGARAVFVPSTFRKFDYAAMAARLAGSLPDLDFVFTVRGAGPRVQLPGEEGPAASISDFMGLRRRVKPPFTCRFSPVMKHSSLPSQTTAAAMSSEVPMRPSG